MGLNFFTELNATNRAHCAAHGFSSAELYGTAPTPEEYETHELIAAGVPAEAAGMFSIKRMRAADLRLRKIIVFQQRAIRLRNSNYAPGRFANFAKRERGICSIVEAA